MQGLFSFFSLTTAVLSYMVRVLQIHRTAHSCPKVFLTFTNKMDSTFCVNILMYIKALYKKRV